MEEKLKILAVADLHGDTRLVEKLAKKSEKEKVDLVVICGDILGWVETDNLIKPFKERNKEVVVIPGNWDSFATVDFLASFYGVKNVHGYSVIHRNVGFFGAGGAVDSPGEGEISEKELYDVLERAHSGLKGIEKKIMLTHMHPAESASELTGIIGSKVIRNAVRKFRPKLLLHGHIHEAGGFEEMIDSTRIVNVSREGRIIEI